MTRLGLTILPLLAGLLPICLLAEGLTGLTGLSRLTLTILLLSGTILILTRLGLTVRRLTIAGSSGSSGGSWTRRYRRCAIGRGLWVLPRLSGLPVRRRLLTIGRGLLALLSVGRLLLTICRGLLLSILSVLPWLLRLPVLPLLRSLLLSVLPLLLLAVAASVPARRLLGVSSTRCCRLAHQTTDHAGGSVGLGQL